MEREDSNNSTSQRWTCEACGCNTNLQSDRTCSICGTSSGQSLLRRAGYAARSGLFSRGFAARRGMINEDIDDLWDRVVEDRVVDGVELAGGDDDENAISALAMEVADSGSISRIRESGRQSIIDAARTFSLSNRETAPLDPQKLLQTATENAPHFQPKWATVSQLLGRVNSGNGIEVGKGERQNIAHLPIGAGEGRAVRAAEAIPKSIPFSSYSMPSSDIQSHERRQRRAFGFRVAFDHARRETGSSLGGCYLVGVTTSSFSAFGDRNGLRQSPFFWGVEDGGKKYEGSRYSHSSRSSRRRTANNFSVELGSDEVPCNTGNVLFGCREVVTVVVDFESRTLTFWKDNEMLGTLISNLPRSGNLYPVAVPFNIGVTVAITGMDGDPLQILRTFASGWKQAQQQKDEERRQTIALQRSILIVDGRPTPELVHRLKNIFTWYASEVSQSNAVVTNIQLNYVATARLWYRCGMKLSSVNKLFKEQPMDASFVSFKDFLDIITHVIREEESSREKSSCTNRPPDSVFEVGDRVELVEGYERYGDAPGGPLQPGDRGMVVELQQGSNGERHSIRVLHSGRRWWYQPQAVLSERSKLIESADVWFIGRILRRHGFDHTTLQPMWGKALTQSSWQVGDIVAPKISPPSHAIGMRPCSTEACFGRIVAETTDSLSSSTARGRDSGIVLVEFMDEGFGEAAGASITGSANNSTLKTCRIQVNNLIHSTVFHGGSVVIRSVDYSRAEEKSSFFTVCVKDFHDSSDNEMDVTSDTYGLSSNGPFYFPISEKVKADITAIAKLDIGAIERVTKECKKHAFAIVSMFSAGLPDAIIMAIENAEEKLKNEDDVNALAQPISTLGTLAAYIVEKSFMLDNIGSDEDENESILEDTMEESNTNSPSFAQNSNSSPEPAEGNPRTHGDDDFVQDPNLTSRISSLQQRRNVLLALMSRARRNNTNSINDFIERENRRHHQEISVGQISPSNGPSRQGPGGQPFLFGQQSEPSFNNSFRELEDVDDRNLSSFTENSDDSHNDNTRSSRRLPLPYSNNESSPFLSSILRGHGETIRAKKIKIRSYPCASQLSSVKSIIMDGLLNNNLHWLSAVVESEKRRAVLKNHQVGSHVLNNAVDEHGTPILLLAISLGCSNSILNHIIQFGALVGVDELRKAALTNQPKAISILLQNSTYSDGMIELDHCAPEVVAVLRAGWARQEKRNKKMWEEGNAFVMRLLKKLLQLTLHARHSLPFQTHNNSSQAMSEVLVGNVLLHAIQRTQHDAKADVASYSAKTNKETFQQSLSSRGTVLSDARQTSNNVYPQGLIEMIPKEALCNFFLSSTCNITQYLLLVEDYLCSKEVSDSAVGLSLLLALLKKFPFFSRSSEMERFGICELVSSHDVIASSRLAEILSRQLPGRLESSSSVMLKSLDLSCSIEPSKLALNGIIRCPKEHTAGLHITRHSSFRCDLCGKGVERGRPMHGCRECDWDACEECTDKTEGGFVKCSHVKALSMDCQKLLSRRTLPQEVNLCKLEDWEESTLEKLNLRNNSIDLNRLSIRLLQRDMDAVKELTGMLKIQGRITVHQFVTVILPSLHASLLAHSPENDRSNRLLHLGDGHKNKKPRIVGGSMHGVDAAPEVHVFDRTAFCRDAITFLLAGVGDKKLKSGRTSKGMQILDDLSDVNSTHGSFISAAEPQQTDSKIDEIRKEEVGKKSRPPEVLRRLHQALSLYETVTLVSKSSLSNRQTGACSSAGTLQALTQTIEMNLSPTAFENQPGVCRAKLSLTLRSEPLVSMKSIEQHVIRSVRLDQPAYDSFCRRLAMDKAIIVERSALRGKQHNGGKRRWRLAQVVAFDGASGAHILRYATQWNRNDALHSNMFEIRRGCFDKFETLQFDERKTKFILAVREYHILSRDRIQEEASANKVDLSIGRHPPDGVLPDTNDKTDINESVLSLGSRVVSSGEASNGSLQALTVIVIEPVEGRLVLVSDSGEVFSDVPSNQVIRLGHNSKTKRQDTFEGHLSNTERRNIALEFGSRSFPFLNSRHHLSSKRDTQDSRTSAKRVGALKRNWSALSLVESMEPIEICASFNHRDNQQGVITDGFVWKCSVGNSDIFIAAENIAVEAPPKIRVEFSAQETLPTIGMSLDRDMTLICALKHLCGRDETLNDQNLLSRGAHRLFYSIIIDFDARTEKELLSPKTLQPTTLERSISLTKASEDKSSRDPRFSLSKPSFAQVLPGSNATSVHGEYFSWPSQESRFQTSSINSNFHDEQQCRVLCEGLGEICVQCMEVIGLISEFAGAPSLFSMNGSISTICLENNKLSKKLIEQLEDPLAVIGGALPPWCEVAPMFAPPIFSYKARRLLLERAAFGVSRSVLKQQEAKVNVGRLRQRMADLRARAVELVGEAFSSGAEDPTALQLQADELYGMEEALAARVKAAFHSEQWEEHSLQVVKAAVRREKLLFDAAVIMNKYANDESVCRRRLEVRFEKESGFDAAAGEAGVTRGFYADVAEALLNCENVTSVYCPVICTALPNAPSTPLFNNIGHIPRENHIIEFAQSKLPMWIPDVDSSGQVIIPTPRADLRSLLGVFPRPLSTNHPQIEDVLIRFRFIGRLFAAALRDGFMFPLPLSSSFLKLVQHGGEGKEVQKIGWVLESKHISWLPPNCHELNVEDNNTAMQGTTVKQDMILKSSDLPRPGFLGGEVFGVEAHTCRALDCLDNADPPLSRYELDKRYQEIAVKKDFARVVLGRSYDCSFDDYFQDRTFVDPLDPTQGEKATFLCPDGYKKPVTVYNIREWVALAKQFMLHDGVLAQALAFRCGISDFFLADYLRLFTAEELQRDVCGVGDKVDTWEDSDVRKLFKLDGGKGAAEALVAVAAIGGEGGVALSRRFAPSSPTINFLVKALLEASPKQRRQFLSFVTSVPIVTPGRIEIVPMVSPSGGFLPMHDPGCLPRANTCARRLYLPKFETYSSFSMVLWAVVREESKFKGFFEWRGS